MKLVVFINNTWLNLTIEFLESTDFRLQLIASNLIALNWFKRDVALATTIYWTEKSGMVTNFLFRMPWIGGDLG